MLNSIPKSGTHLLLDLFRNIEEYTYSGLFLSHIHHGKVELSLSDRIDEIRRYKGGLYFGAHLPYSENDATHVKQTRLKHILLIRDPRDMLVSQLFHAKDRPTNRLNRYLSKLNDDYSRLEALIYGIESSVLGLNAISHQNYVEYLASFLDWHKREKGILTIKFEDLVGIKGGSDKARQQQTVGAILDYIGLGSAYPERRMKRVLEAINRKKKTNTMRKGKIGGWKYTFDKSSTSLIGQSLHHIAQEMGYS
jgi:hypothetical protein